MAGIRRVHIAALNQGGGHLLQEGQVASEDLARALLGLRNFTADSGQKCGITQKTGVGPTEPGGPVNAEAVLRMDGAGESRGFGQI